MVVLALAALLTAGPMDPQAVAPPQVTPAQAMDTRDEPVELREVVVTGQPLETLIRDFVNEVAEPNPRRGLARWNQSLCVGAANLRTEAAQYLVDRVSTVAEDLGLQTGQPGCTPNVLIIATADSGELAAGLVEERRRAFRMGGSGMDRGRVALADFKETDRPVRWWQMSLPVDSESGMRATRIPGECRDPCEEPESYAPHVSVFAASRVRTQIVDNIIRTIVIVDVDEVSGLSIQQLADYIAMVTLAQINPEADTRAYASILNVFEEPGSTQHLTDWDLAYLEGLYAAERNDANRRANRSEVQDSIRRAHRRIQDQGEPTAED